MIEIKDLHYKYSDEKREKKFSFINMEFKIPAGEKVALAGSNGSGKTTLLKLIAGLLKPQNGIITVNQKPVKYKKFENSPGILFQMAEFQLFTSRVIDDVMFGMKEKGKEAFEKAMEVLKLVGCENLYNEFPHNLSGGEKKLVALASILAMEPSVILLDEPTSGLDIKNRRKVISILNSLEYTMIIASHDLEFLLETCSEVIILNNGKISAEGNIKEIFSNRDLMHENSLEVPHSLIPHPHYVDKMR